jgi:hypothetical protein
MTEISVRHLQPFARSAVPAVSPVMNRVAKRLGMASWQRELIVVAAFCAIGLMVSFAVLAQVPGWSEAIGQISLVP